MNNNSGVGRKRASRITVPILLIIAALAAVTPAFGDIIYSGPENLVFQAAPNNFEIFYVEIAGNHAAWDTLGLMILTENVGYSENVLFPESQVSLGSTAADLPYVARFQYGDPYPSSPVFNQFFLWNDGAGSADGDFYAAMEFQEGGTGPERDGWIHFDASNTSSSNPVLTVIDWAYAVGESIVSMGQGSPAPGSSGGGTSVPEIDPNSGMSALALLSGALLVTRGRRTPGV